MIPDSSKVEPSRRRRGLGARHFIETYFTSIALSGCTLVQGVILARALGADGRGDYAAIILWPNIIANIGLIGTNMSVTRSAALTGNDIGPIARTGILLSLIPSTVFVVVGLLSLPLLIPKQDSEVIGLAQTYMVLFVPAFILSASMAGVDHGQGRFRRLNFFRLLQSPVYVFFLVVLILLGRANLTYCIYALMAAFWVTVLGRFTLLVRQIPLLGPLVSLANLLRQGLPYLVSCIIGQFTHRGDRILLLWFLTDRDLGLYAVAFSAAGILADLPQSIGLVSLSIAAQEEPGEGFARIAQIFRGATIVSVTMGIFLALGAYLMLPVLYGREFADARMIAVILAGGFTLFGLTSLLSQSMQGQGKPLAGTFSRLVGLGVMVLVAFVLSRFLGVVGVALGFVAAQLVSLYSLLLLLVRHYHSASMVDMVPTIKDVRLLSRRLKQQAVAVLVKSRVIRSPAHQDVSTSKKNTR